MLLVLARHDGKRGSRSQTRVLAELLRDRELPFLTYLRGGQIFHRGLSARHESLLNVVRAFRALGVPVKLDLGDIDGHRRRCGDHNAKHQKVLNGTL